LRRRHLGFCRLRRTRYALKNPPRRRHLHTEEKQAKNPPRRRRLHTEENKQKPPAPPPKEKTPKKTPKKKTKKANCKDCRQASHAQPSRRRAGKKRKFGIYDLY